MRDSVLTADMLGPYNTVVGTVDYGLKAGDTQKFEFGVGDPPPFDDQDAPRNDGEKIKVQGFEGKPKGVKQVLFERGWWNPDVKMRMSMPKAKIDAKGVAGALPNANTIGSDLLASLPDFRDEKSELEKLVHGRGHILTMSPKCHPELAGHGIEYCWGASKLYFRRHNDLVPKNFFKNVLKSIDVITRSQVHMFERRARAYRTALKDEALNTFDLVEKAVAKRKAHRNAVDFDSGFIKRVMAMR